MSRRALETGVFEMVPCDFLRIGHGISRDRIGAPPDRTGAFSVLETVVVSLCDRGPSFGSMERPPLHLRPGYGSKVKARSCLVTKGFPETSRRWLSNQKVNSVNAKQKVVVLGGSGMAGAKVVKRLEGKGLEAVAASRRSGVDLLSGEGLVQTMRGASVVIDTTNVPAYDEETLMTFFAKAGEHIGKAEREAGVSHHAVLSIVGIDTVPHIAYAHGKIAQERAAADSGIPYTILRATQFYEWLGSWRTISPKAALPVPDAHLQPVAIDDVVEALAEVAVAPPVNGIVSIAGPGRGYVRGVDSTLSQAHR